MKFWDSSALVPLLVAEAQTGRMQALAARDSDMLVWWGSEVECASALARLGREGAFDRKGAQSAFKRLSQLADGWHEIEPGENVREAARITPDDRILIETDAPFLAPIPYRGKRNEPAMMLETLKKLAEVRGTTPERIAELTTANFERLCFERRLPPTIPTRYTEISHGN